MNLIIREMIEHDLRAIRSVFVDCGVSDSFLSDDRLKAAMSRGTGVCYVAVDDGIIVGAAFGSHDGVLTGYVHKVAVNKKYRRQKLGGTLVRKILDRFDDVRLPRVIATFPPSDEILMSFSAAAGFKQPEKSVIFVRTLPSSKPSRDLRE